MRWLFAACLVTLSCLVVTPASQGGLFSRLRARFHCQPRVVCASSCVASSNQPYASPDYGGTAVAPQVAPAIVSPESASTIPPSTPVKEEWRALFNGEDLDDWKATDFGGEGNVDVKDKLLIMHVGEPLTGVTWKGDDLPKENYELVCRAQRMDGLDFFCGITFPIGESYASFIPAGWSGGVTGLSSINGYDASENETTTYVKFENKKWYDFKIQVTGKTVVVFVDKDRVIRITREGKKINTRIEVDLSKPLGLAAFRSKGAVETLKIRDLSPAEIAEIDKPLKQ